jgi:hypothetical protein
MASSDLVVSTGLGATFVPEGGGATVNFPVTEWSLNYNSNIIPMPNARDGMIRKATLVDVTGSLGSFYDEADCEPGVTILNGDRGELRLWVNADGTRYWKIPAIMSCTVSTSGQTSALMANWTFEFTNDVSGVALTSPDGTILVPAAA